MPTYDYRCPACERRFEVTRPMGSSAEESCPDCGETAKRVFTPVGVAFKGTGFHNTDYKPSGSASAPAPAPACPSAGEGGCSGCAAASSGD